MTKASVERRANSTSVLSLFFLPFTKRRNNIDIKCQIITQRDFRHRFSGRLFMMTRFSYFISLPSPKNPICYNNDHCGTVSLVEAGGAHWLVHLLKVIVASSSEISTASNLTFTLFRGGSYSETLEQCGKVILPCTLNLDNCNKREKKAVEYLDSTGMSCGNW